VRCPNSRSSNSSHPNDRTVEMFVIVSASCEVWCEWLAAARRL
jgi:hypothetical protein